MANQDKWFEYLEYDNILTDIQTQTVTVKRRTEDRRPGGDYVARPGDAVTVSTSLKVSIQPEQSMFAKMAAGERDIERLFLYTEDMTTAVRKGDVFTLDLGAVTGEVGATEQFLLEGIEKWAHHRKFIVRSLAVTGSFKPAF